ncbi:MAG: molybdopterin molybdotransferase [Nocardioidaceae bacterium]|jgi:molybdopterin molybdotransferase|nr:molybdopterin molybdotransferase [Nocardioidaceae bacterium]MDX6308883.1 molybdopterin molybdotransferase [Nocardioidaceae bacterium]
MRSVEEHLNAILDVVSPLPPYEQPLLEALGLPICIDVTADIDLPSFDNSAMDGYAVRFEDVKGASEDTPVVLPVVGESAAGQTKAYALSSGQAVKIMTGAPMPAGADAVVPVEWTDGGRARVRIAQPPEPGQHVRPRGDDIVAGELLLEEGDVLGPRQVAILAATGRSRVKARPRPRVVVISTGSELREPGTQLGFDSIHDSNSYMLAAQSRAADAIAYRVGIVTDDPHELTATLSDQLVRADLVVTSGGVSKGEYDVVKEVLSRLGTVSFDEVSMQPGKPQGFGTIGEDQTPIFTLPGNPVSSYVSFEVFVLPALRRMMGKLPYRRPSVRATCRSGFRSPPGRRQFMRGRFEVTGRGPFVTPVGGHGSHLIGGLSRSNCLIVVPEAKTEIEEGSMVDTLVLDRNF